MNIGVSKNVYKLCRGLMKLMRVQSDVSKFVVDHAHLPELCSNVALRSAHAEVSSSHKTLY